MNKEFSSGAIIYRREEGKLYFLVIYSQRNKIWCFPKGHIEKGENEKTAALREIQEETGLKDITFIDKFKEEDVYKTTGSRGPNKGRIIEKHSIYYLAETKTMDIIVDAEEISEYKWLEYLDARKLLPFDSLKQVLRKAIENIYKQGTDWKDPEEVEFYYHRLGMLDIKETR